MPLDNSLRKRAEHNERFLETFSITHSPYLDWAVIVAFYTAVRYVDAYFYPRRPFDHGERLRWIEEDPRTRPIRREYRELYNESRGARYELVTFTPAQVDRLLRNTLSRIKTHMTRQ